MLEGILQTWHLRHAQTESNEVHDMKCDKMDMGSNLTNHIVHLKISLTNISSTISLVTTCSTRIKQIFNISFATTCKLKLNEIQYKSANYTLIYGKIYVLKLVLPFEP